MLIEELNNGPSAYLLGDRRALIYRIAEAA